MNFRHLFIPKDKRLYEHLFIPKWQEAIWTLDNLFIPKRQEVTWTLDVCLSLKDKRLYEL